MTASWLGWDGISLWFWFAFVDDWGCSRLSVGFICPFIDQMIGFCSVWVLFFLDCFIDCRNYSGVGCVIYQQWFPPISYPVSLLCSLFPLLHRIFLILYNLLCQLLVLFLEFLANAYILLSPSNQKVSGLTSISLIHFEFIFIHDEDHS